MSKIWKNPITLPSWVSVDITDDLVSIIWPKGKLSQKMYPGITPHLDGETLTVNCDDVALWKYWGTMRSLLAHMVKWVSEWYSKTLQVIGVWFDAALQGATLTLKLWFSHPVLFSIPDGIEAKVEKDPKGNALIYLSSHDKQLIWQVAAKIRKLKKPEPYKGKWIRFLGEVIKMKAGKSAKK